MLLSNGTVLVTGGRFFPDEDPTAPWSHGAAAPPVYPFAEAYDPAANTWRPAGPMVLPRAGNAAVTLQDGRVLVMGGSNETFRYCPPCDPMSSAEIYDPATGGWSAVTPMDEASAQPTAVLLADGGVLVTGHGGATEVFHAAPTAAQAAAVGWVAPTVAGVLAALLTASVSLVVILNRRGGPPRGGRRTASPQREPRGAPLRA